MFVVKIFVCTAIFSLIGLGSAEASLKVTLSPSKTNAELHSGSKMANVSGISGITAVNSFLKTPAGILTSAVIATSGSPLPPHTPAFSACRYLKNLSRTADAAATIGWVATKAATASGAEQVAAIVGVVTAGATAIAAPTQIVV